MILTGENWSRWGNPHSNAALSSTNPKQTGLALKPGIYAAICTDHLPENIGNIIFGQSI
jgi:hypothetical protein